MKEVRKKILPESFNEVRLGNKNFELRKDEDDIRIGDILVLDEWKDTGNALTSGYTGWRLRRQVKYVLRDVPQLGLKEGYCIIGW